MKLRKLNLGRLFYNNKVVMLFSVILSFICWMILSTSASETATKLISDIPISVHLSENAKASGLTVFGAEDIKAEISVTGNRLILGQLSKNDIQITAQQSANMINSTGKYTLELTAKKNSILTDYEFASPVSPKFITVFVDRHKSQDFEIAPNIKFTADPNYFVAPIALSEPTVTISGPESVVSSIASVTVDGNISGTLNKTVDLHDLPINLLDSKGNKINTTNLVLSVSSVDANITVLQRKFVTVTPEFTSTPSSLNIKSLSLQVSPNKIEVAAPNEILSNLTTLQLEPIDFSQIDLDHCEFEQNIKLPTDCRSLANIQKSEVKLNLLGFQERTVVAKDIKFKNLPSDKVATAHTASLPIKVVGPIGQLRALTEADISIEVDLADKKEFTGRTEMPAKIVFDSSGSRCWAYGHYKVNVGITQK